MDGKQPNLDSPILAEIVRRLVEVYHPERIYLFGSVARGEAGPDSDYDFMVVVSDDTPAELRDCARAYQAFWGITPDGVGTASDVLVWTRSYFERTLHLKSSLPSTVLREGRLLYAA
jgi:predicted nucleotidyltransferase